MNWSDPLALAGWKGTYMPSQSPGAYFITEDAPDGINPLMATLTGDTPGHLRGSDPISAAMQGFASWYGVTPAAQSQGSSASGGQKGAPWYTNVGVIFLAVLLIAMGVWVTVK